MNTEVIVEDIVLSPVNEAVKSLMLPVGSVSLILKSIVRVAHKGRLTIEEIRHLGEHLPGAARTAASALGVTIPSFFKMTENGEVLAEDFITKFSEELHRVYGGDEK